MRVVKHFETGIYAPVSNSFPQLLGPHIFVKIGKIFNSIPKMLTLAVTNLQFFHHHGTTPRRIFNTRIQMCFGTADMTI
jgi:hypothetical protein